MLDLIVGLISTYGLGAVALGVAVFLLLKGEFSFRYPARRR
jgi:hypothetical protein